MIEAVFISDLHLSPSQPEISKRFQGFLTWAGDHVRAVYILGDFFHAWAGDDTLDEWSLSIAHDLAALVKKGVSIYFMSGNRDFLLGESFMRQSKMKPILEPEVIELGKSRIVLVHGDRYCTRDRMHQWFRRLTRNAWFSRLFLKIPKAWRLKLVARVREYSMQQMKQRSTQQMQVVPQRLLSHLKQQKAFVVIHGHTHQAGLTRYEDYQQYVLSDWDDEPQLLCYDKSKGLYYIQLKL